MRMSQNPGRVAKLQTEMLEKRSNCAGPSLPEGTSTAGIPRSWPWNPWNPWNPRPFLWSSLEGVMTVAISQQVPDRIGMATSVAEP